MIKGGHGTQPKASTAFQCCVGLLRHQGRCRLRYRVLPQDPQDELEQHKARARSQAIRLPFARLERSAMRRISDFLLKGVQSGQRTVYHNVSGICQLMRVCYMYEKRPGEKPPLVADVLDGLGPPSCNKSRIIWPAAATLLRSDN